jgi:hypothetical protein
MNLLKIIGRPLIPFIIIILSFGQLTSCTSGSSSDPKDPAFGTNTAIALAFLLDIPEFFAWKDGDGPWTEVTSISNNLKLDVTDSDGRFSYVAYGNYRGDNRAYYVESTLGDAMHHNLTFDDTSGTTTYNIDINVSNYTTGGVWIGTDYKSFANLVTFSSPTSNIPYQLTQDDDDPVIGDYFLILEAFSQPHKKQETIDFTTMPMITYAPMPADVGTLFTVDHSAVHGDPEYQGISFKLSGPNLKALLAEDAGAAYASNSIAKYTVPADNIYSLSARWFTAKSASVLFDADYKYAEYYNDPPATVTIDTKPAPAPDVTIGTDGNYSVKIEYSGRYSSGISGVTNVVRGARVGEWTIKQTMSRYQPSGAQTFGIDASLFNGMFPYLVGKEPGTGDVTRVSFYESNRDPEKALNYQFTSHKASADDDLMVTHRLNLNF